MGNDTVKNVISKLATLIKRQGFLTFSSNFGEYIKWRYRKFREKAFDRIYSIDTLQTNSNYFDSSQSLNTEFAVPYEPVHRYIFNEMIKSASIGRGKYTFVDLGSGKGRALLFASDYDFNRIVGVEFSRELHQIAENNINKFLSKTGKQNNFLLECLDVVNYELPATDLVVFLYNPFFGKVMDKVVYKINTFLENSTFDLVILYRNPQCAELFDNIERLQKVMATKSYSIYRRRL